MLEYFLLIVIASPRNFWLCHTCSSVPFRPFRKYIFCSGTRAGSPRKHEDNQSEQQLPYR